MQMQVLSDSLNRDRDRQLMLERSLKEADLSELVEASARVSPTDPTRLTAVEQLEATRRRRNRLLTSFRVDVARLEWLVHPRADRRELRCRRAHDHRDDVAAECRLLLE